MKAKALDHLIDLEKLPAMAGQNQAAYDRLRLRDVEAAKITRPHFLPIRHDMAGSGATLPVSEKTSELQHNVIITGAVTDADELRRGQFYRRRNDTSFFALGDEPDTRITLDAIAGKSLAAGGFAGTQDFVAPIRLSQEQVITLEIYEDAFAADVIHTVFKGLRVFEPRHLEGQLNPNDRADVEAAIRKYYCPEPRYLASKVVFKADGTALTKTPQQDEPLLVHGFRATFTDALINFGLNQYDGFANEYFPIWALCAEPGNARQVWQRLKYPILVPKKQQLYFKLKNTIDGTDYATDGVIETLATTC